MKTSTILHEAADLIEKRGWTYAHEALLAGRHIGTVWGDSDGTGPMCIEGAIGIAAGITSSFQVTTCAAGRAMSQYLGLPDGKRLFTWNDKLTYLTGVGSIPVHTQAEVIEVLRAAAVIEESRESELSAVSPVACQVVSA